MQNAQHQNRKSICIMLNVIVHSRLSSQSVVNSRQNKTGTNRKPDLYLFHWFWLGCIHYKNLKSMRGTQRVKIYISVGTHWQGTYWDGHISFFLFKFNLQEYVSCPSCGRTLFDLQEISAQIREKTSHLPGVSVSVFFLFVWWIVCSRVLFRNL